jgi:RND family efflux transporter MFP subunit
MDTMMDMSTEHQTAGSKGSNGHVPVNRIADSHLVPAVRRSGFNQSAAVRTVQPRRWRMVASYALAGGLAAAALGAGIRPWLQHRTQPVSSAVAMKAERQVTVALPEQQVAGSVLLPATVEPFQVAKLYARVPGYVKAWHVELGQPVKQGQVVAEIDTPELDQELLQARADLNVAQTAIVQSEAELRESEAAHQLAKADQTRSEAELSLAGSRLRRREALLKNNATTQDDFDTATRDRDARQADQAASEAGVTRQAANVETRRAVIESRKASVESQQANVRRLEQLQAFRRIEAPFDGVVTRRRAEVGNLVNATSAAAGDELYEIAQVDRLRVQTPVPQSEAASVHVGTAVTVQIPERPDQQLAAVVTRTSRAVDPKTRTLLVEIEVPNADEMLSPGLYAEVSFATQAPKSTWMVPANTVRMQVDGPHVVVATEQGRLDVRSVRLGRDYGRHVAVVEGVHGREQLVVNPTDDLRSGMSVKVSQPAAPVAVALK